MTAQDVLLDWLDTVAARLMGELEDMSSEEYRWHPDAEGNTIALTVWHVARSWDALATRVLRNEPAAQELWHRNGWRDKTGYDPRGKGPQGIGNLYGYTREEVAEVPEQAKNELTEYLNQTHQAFRSELKRLDSIESVVQGEDRIKYESISNFIRDGYEHLGEIKALRAMWARRTEQ